MLRWAIGLGLIALVVGFFAVVAESFGFYRLAAYSGEGAGLLSVVFLLLAVPSLLGGVLKARALHR